MKKSFITVAAIAAAVTIGLISCDFKVKKTTTGDVTQDSLVKRGEYLVTTMGCDDCHSPKKFGPQGPEVISELRLSGYPGERPLSEVDSNTLKKGWALMNHDLTAAVGPWGVSYAANLTSDSTGIGMWTEEQFFKALREGKAKGLDNNRPILPPMPWFNFKHLTDHDIKAIYSFLKSTKPVKNVVPAPRQLSQL